MMNRDAMVARGTTVVLGGDRSNHLWISGHCSDQGLLMDEKKNESLSDVSTGTPAETDAPATARGHGSDQPAVPGTVRGTPPETTAPSEVTRVYVVELSAIFKHPKADRLEILRLYRPGWGIEVVAGMHYREGQLGVYLPTGSILPGWLAETLWLVGAGPSANRWFTINPKIMRGVFSAGLFAGQTFKKVREDANEEWRAWPIWQAKWKLGDDVTDYIGVQCPGSSVSEERLLAKQEVGQTANVPGLDSSPGLQPQ